MDYNKYVTIGVPIYNVEKFIERCAIALFEQSYKYIKYIFVDDCGTDNSISRLNSIIERYPERQKMVRIIKHEKNRGLSAARNTIVSNCDTEYLLHVDSDDYLDTSAIELCVSKLNEANYDIVFFSNVVLWANYKEILSIPCINNPRDLLKSLLTKNYRITVWGALIKTELYKVHGISAKEGVNMGEDLQVMPLLLYYSKIVTSINAPLYYYDRTNESAYTATFSIPKSEQTWQSMLILEKQIADDEVLSWVNFLKLNTLIAMAKMNCLAKNGDVEYYKGTLMGRIDSIDNKYKKQLSKSNRLIVSLRNRRLIRTYLRCIRQIRKINEKH